MKAEALPVKVEAKESTVKVEELPVKPEATDSAQAKAEELPAKAEAEESTAQLEVKVELPVKTTKRAPRPQLLTVAEWMFAQPGTAEYEEQEAKRLAAMKGKPSDDGVVYALGDTRQLIGKLSQLQSQKLVAEIAASSTNT
eukprot:5853-Heterococcus_DN1.PRE.5